MFAEALQAHPTRALISVPAFRNNLGVVRSHVGPDVKIMAIVKANAYGHGAVRLAGEAIAAGADYLGVARVHEGLEIRAAGISDPALVFEVVPHGAEEAALKAGLELTVVHVESAGRISGAASALGMTARVHVKVDTGMGRLGMSDRQAAGIIESIARLPHVAIAGVYSHFATSDSKDPSFAREQLERFAGVLEELARRKIQTGIRHMANSGAILTMPEASFDMVRPGIMLYGYPPRRGMESRAPLMPVMALESTVSMLKTVDEKTSISYGRRYFTRTASSIATIPIGYADGFVRLLTNRADALINGRRYPIVGTVCMDHVMADVGQHSDVREGDRVTLIGRQGGESIDSWDIAEKIGTIPYEVTCLVTPRVPRIYVY